MVIQYVVHLDLSKHTHTSTRRANKGRKSCEERFSFLSPQFFNITPKVNKTCSNNNNHTHTHTHSHQVETHKHIRPIYCTLYEKFLENYFLSQYIIHFCTCHKQMKHDHEVIFYRLYFFFLCVLFLHIFLLHTHTQIDETRVPVRHIMKQYKSVITVKDR